MSLVKVRTFFLTRRQALHPLLDGTPGISPEIKPRTVLRKRVIGSRENDICPRNRDPALVTPSASQLESFLCRLQKGYNDNN
jgi:hypothetical protein